MSLHVYTSEGTRVLPPANLRPVSVSFDCNALSRLTKPKEYSRDPEALALRRWLRQCDSDHLELIIGPAVVESVYKHKEFRLRDLPALQACKLNQLTGRRYEVPDPLLHAQSVASTLMNVVGHVLNIIAMREAFDEHGAKQDEASARKRLEHFIRWSKSAPQLGGTSILGVAMHEAVTFNTEAKVAFGLGATKVDFSKLLNGAWDLYQLGFLLDFESGFLGQQRHAMTAYLTWDRRLASVFGKVGVVDAVTGIIGVEPITLMSYPALCELSQNAIQHVRELPETFEAFRHQAHELARVFGSFSAKVDEEGLHNLHWRLEEVCRLLDGQTGYLFPARRPGGVPRFSLPATSR